MKFSLIIATVAAVNISSKESAEIEHHANSLAQTMLQEAGADCD